MTKEEASKLQPFDVVIYKDKDKGNVDVLVKSVSDNGVFTLPRIQSTTQLTKFEDLEKQF